MMKRALALACLLTLAGSGFLLQGCATAIIAGGGQPSGKGPCSERDARNGKCLTLTQESF